MKKIIIIIVLTVLPLFGFSQTSIFDKFEDMDDVTTIVINQNAFRMLSKVSGDSQEVKEYMDIVKSLTSLKVFTTEKESIANEMKSIVAKYLKSEKLSELMRIKDKGANVKIYVREGKDEDHVRELLMYVNEISENGGHGQEAVILSLTGDINLNNISKITNQHIKADLK